MWVEETAARVELAPSDVSADGQSGSYSELEVGLGEICRTPEPGRHPATNLRHLPEARLNEALGADAFACPVSAVVCERIRLGHKENTYDPPSQNDARRTRAS